jgi:hypothetical protein
MHYAFAGARRGRQNAPRWQPATLAEVDEALVERSSRPRASLAFEDGCGRPGQAPWFPTKTTSSARCWVRS